MTDASAKSKSVSLPLVIAGVALGITGVWYLNRPETATPVSRPQPTAAAPLAFPPGMYDTPEEVRRAMEGFHTFDGRPVDAVLGSIGLHVSSVFVDATSQNRAAGDLPGDLTYDVTMAGKLIQKPPCENIRPTPGAAREPILEEMVRREGAFPFADEAGDTPTGPILYWVATGNCSKAY